MVPFFVCIVLFFWHTGPLDICSSSFLIAPTASLDCFYNIADESPGCVRLSSTDYDTHWSVPNVVPSSAFGTRALGFDGFPDIVFAWLGSLPDGFPDIVFVDFVFVSDGFPRIVSKPL